MKTKDRNYVRESSWILLIVLIALALGACAMAPSDAGEPQGQPQASSSKTPLATLNPILPTQGDNSQMTPFPPTPSGLESLIEKAKDDLAQRLSIPTSDITLVDAKVVTWPDSSIGCPQPDMMYAQVLTPGYLILLKANNNEYEYHAGRNASVIYCENPMPPVEGMPGDI